MKKPDLLRMRPVEHTDRLGGGLQQNLAALFRKIRLGFRREMHIAYLARAENELLASPLEDKLRFVFREGRAIALEISYSHSDSRSMRDTNTTRP